MAAERSAGRPRHSAGSWLTRGGALRVPEVTVAFWVLKGLSTAMGEATSDWLVHSMVPQLAVVLGFVAFVAALAVQLTRRRYVAWSYWLAVGMVGIFGTMAADVLHVALGVPYEASTALYAVVLAAVLFSWWRTERTLSIHRVDTTRRELFYWLTVMATFAMGTALGDLCAYSVGLGYFPSALLFAGLIVVPAAGYRLAGWNGVLSFWFAYIVTRPLGASLADGFGKPKAVSGAGLGDGPVAVVLAAAMVVLVAWLSLTRADVQEPAAGLEPG